MVSCETPLERELSSKPRRCVLYSVAMGRRRPVTGNCPRNLCRPLIAQNDSGVVNEKTVSLGMVVDSDESDDSGSDGSVV